ncbi:glutathione ABC transporter substrate-binding protein [Symbiobacterium thermophilum]|nr:glutathione ABC transporter substrate-binding protein [Symbiobacterium thermophilum]
MKKRVLPLLLALALAVLSACGGGANNQNQNQTPNQQTGGQTAPKEQVITIAHSGDPATLDPHKSFNGLVFTVTNQIYETLLYRAADGTLQPRLATEWAPVDETTWEFKLREGVKFSDGTPLNAEAVKFSLERLADPETKGPGAFIVGMIEEITVVDDHTVHIRTSTPFTPLLAHLSHPVTAIVSPTAATSGDLSKQPAGTGPFLLEDWKAGDSVTLKANPDYWGGKPKLDRVVLRIIPEAGTQLTELKAGTVDLISGVQPERFNEIDSDPQLSATRFLGWGSMFLGFNMKAGPLAQPEVRQAIAMAIDPQGIVDTLRQGMAQFGNSLVPPTVFGSVPDLTGPEYDPEGARALLAQAGVTTPLKLTLNTYEGAENQQIAQAIQAQLSQIGIDLEVVITDYGAFTEAIAKDDHGLWLSSWGTVTMDADYTLWALLHSGQHGADNKAFYANPQVDEWLTEARRTADDAQRQALYRQIHEQVMKDLPYLNLYYPLSSYAKNDRLQGEVYPFAAINLDLRKAEVK